MRKGITARHQREMVSFLRRLMKLQLYLGGIIVLIAIVAAWSFPAPVSPPAPGIALVQPTEGVGGGSGVLVGSQVLLTTANLVGQQKDVYVSFTNGAATSAHVVFADANSDIAMLELSNVAPVPPVPMGDSDQLGDGVPVLIAGFPGGAYSETPAKTVAHTNQLITTDLPAHPGNTGGALLLPDHTLAGLVASTIEFGSKQPARIQLAVPMNVVRTVCRDKGHPID